MIQLEQAHQQILGLVQPRETQMIEAASADGRYLAEEIRARVDLPPFDNSAMDGYAVRAADLEHARQESPVALRLAGQAAAGSPFQGQISNGQCVRVFTGSKIPEGADAVIMQEDTDAAEPDHPRMLCKVAPWENIRFRGEDVRKGELLAAPGQLLTPGLIGLIAANGIDKVSVGRKPLIGLIATGSELIEPSQALAAGQIYESNRSSLAALVCRAGAVPVVYPIVQDDPHLTQATLTTAFTQCDVVVTCGGVSVGDLDFVKAAFESMGGQLDFWRVSLKPGKPFALGRWQGKLLFALPGNPVSAFVTFVLLVRPALLRLQGASEVNLPLRTGVLTEALTNPGDRRHFVRVYLDATGLVRSTGVQASHLLHSLARANGLVDVPPGTTLPSGTKVSVLSWTG